MPCKTVSQDPWHQKGRFPPIAKEKSQPMLTTGKTQCNREGYLGSPMSPVTKDISTDQYNTHTQTTNKGPGKEQPRNATSVPRQRSPEQPDSRKRMDHEWLTPKLYTQNINSKCYSHTHRISEVWSKIPPSLPNWGTLQTGPPTLKRDLPQLTVSMDHSSGHSSIPNSLILWAAGVLGGQSVQDPQSKVGSGSCLGVRKMLLWPGPIWQRPRRLGWLHQSCQSKSMCLTQSKAKQTEMSELGAEKVLLQALQGDSLCPPPPNIPNSQPELQNISKGKIREGCGWLLQSLVLINVHRG